MLLCAVAAAPVADEAAALDDHMEGEKRGDPDYSRILKRAPFSRILRGGGPASFSRILRGDSSLGFNRILR